MHMHTTAAVYLAVAWVARISCGGGRNTGDAGLEWLSSYWVMSLYIYGGSHLFTGRHVLQGMHGPFQQHDMLGSCAIAILV